MRLMSFMLTERQVLERTKTVTRRLGWRVAKPGMRVLAIRKGMGRKAGEPIVPLAALEFVDVRRESLDAITAQEVAAEGFPELDRDEFIRMFCHEMGCAPGSHVTRIEFRYLPMPRQHELPFTGARARKRRAKAGGAQDRAITA